MRKTLIALIFYWPL